MFVLIRGGGDLASGVAYRLFRTGFRVLITEIPKPLAIRRTVSFGEAVYQGEITIEGIKSVLITDFPNIESINHHLDMGTIPVLIDPDARIRSYLEPDVLVDARMLKISYPFPFEDYPLVIGLGPGFRAQENCHAVIETQRGHTLGRVYWEGSGLSDTGIPDGVMGISDQRVIRSPVSGKVQPFVKICDQVEAGQPIAEVGHQVIFSPIKGVVRGLIKAGLEVDQKVKIGDIDPRNDPRLCTLISDKALAIGGGVLEAIMSRIEIRKHIGND